MILQIYTIIHTLISLVAIFTGIVVVFGMLANSDRRNDRRLGHRDLSDPSNVLCDRADFQQANGKDDGTAR